MGDTRPIYLPREGVTAEEETSALASVYRFVIECHERKKAARAEDSANNSEVGRARGETSPLGMMPSLNTKPDRPSGRFEADTSHLLNTWRLRDEEDGHEQDADGRKYPRVSEQQEPSATATQAAQTKPSVDPERAWRARESLVYDGAFARVRSSGRVSQNGAKAGRGARSAASGAHARAPPRPRASCERIRVGPRRPTRTRRSRRRPRSPRSRSDCQESTGHE